MPTVAWQHNGEAIVQTKDVTVETSETFSTLTIKGATGVNSGDYRVTAENVVDIVSEDFTVVIRGEYLTTESQNISQSSFQRV